MRKSAFSTILLAGILATILISSQTAFAEPNLVSWWEFDEGSGGTAYDSAGDNDGTLTGDPEWVAGKIGSYALDFDGSGDYVSVGNIVTHNLAKGTFTAWVNPADLSSVCNDWNFAWVIGADNYTGGELGFRVNGDGSGWASVRNTVPGGALEFPAGSITIGSWYHVAMTWDGSYWKLYVNSVEKDSKSFSQGTSSATNTALIGKGWDGCSWNGTIDDVRIYNRALSAGEIEQLYQEGLGNANKASVPNPVGGAMGVDMNTVLSWQPGENAASHDVYFGTDYNDVNDADTLSPEYKGNFDVNSFDPCGLDSMTTYYWRVDEINDTNVWKGWVWNFKTRDSDDSISYVPSEYLTIQAAIDAAVNGVTVIVAPGTYTGTGNRDIDFLGKAITVRSSDPNDPNVVAATVIDCENSGRGFYFGNGENWDSIVSGLTITRGGGVFKGGGILCEEASPTISRCVIKGNSATYGGGIRCDGFKRTAKISHCTIVNNSASRNGGGIDCWIDSPEISHCVILGNSIGSGTYYGGGIYEGTEDTKISHCIIWGNAEPQIWQSGTVSYCDVQGGYSGTGNIDTDPLFIEPSSGNYHLSQFSPCINAGDPCYISDPYETDFDGEPRVVNNRIDIGPDECILGVPFIYITPSEFMFSANQGDANPDAQILGISNIGGGILNWEVDEDCGWLSVEPNSGSSTGETDEVTLSVDIAGLSAGVYTCELTVSDGNASNNPQMVEVVLSVDAEGVLLVPTEYETIQAAINASVNGDTVIVAPWTHTGPGNLDIDFLGKAITVRSTDPNDPCEVAATVIDCGNASRGFYFHNSENGDSVVSGLTITRGKIKGSPGIGGGIYCNGSSPTIKNCIITNNMAVGNGGSGNGSDGGGGGVYCTSNSHTTLINCEISGNITAGGAGGDRTCTLISGCQGTLGTGGDAYGGGIFGSSDSELTIIDCNIAGNSAAGGQGGTFEDIEMGTMYGMAGGTGNGGGIYCEGDLLIKESIISENVVRGGDDGRDAPEGNDGKGGGIYCTSSSATIWNCIVKDNEAARGGSEVYSYGEAVGGGVFCSSAATITNCTIIENTAIDGGGIAGGGTIITNCIVWGNGDDLYSCTARYSCISDTNDSGDGVIHSDPCFVTGPGGDYYLSQIEAGQSADSPCVDAGSDTAEYLGMDVYTTRTDEVGDGGVADMGYHYSMPNPADIDGDGDVDFVDYAILASQWLEAPGIPSADIAPPPGGDGIVDWLDLGVFADRLSRGVFELPKPYALVSHWKFDEGSGTTAHDSAGGNDGTLVNGPTWTTGQINGALSFDGSDDYVSVPDIDNSLDMDGEMTIAVWVKADDGLEGIVGKKAGSTINYAFVIEFGLLWFYNNDMLYPSTDSVTDGVWEHVAVTLKEGGSVKFYINGAAAGTLAQMGPFGSTNDAPLEIGKALYLFHGDIDDVRIYNRALSATEVEQIYQEGL